MLSESTKSYSVSASVFQKLITPHANKVRMFGALYHLGRISTSSYMNNLGNVRRPNRKVTGARGALSF